MESLLQNLIIDILQALSSDGVHTQAHGEPGSCITTIFKVKFSGMYMSMHNNIVLFLHVIAYDRIRTS